jgi:transcription factor TFIIIB component B''
VLLFQQIFETADKTSNYGSWLKRKKTVDWTEKETVRFFKAMSILGTDFSLMEKLFKRRTRHELKMKYKKEEKANKALIDR